MRRRRRAGTGAVLERISRGVSDRIDDLERRLEIFLGLAGEADDEVAGNGDVGPRGADLLDGPQIAVGDVAAVHRLEDAVAARLHRQMEVGHQFVDLAMGGDQAVGHVGGMAGGVADALQAIDLGERADQAVEARGRRRSRR